MKTTDINAFKGQVKDNILKWAGAQVDQMLPTKVTARAMLKNAAGNILARFDRKVGQAVDAAFLMFGDAQGAIDSDVLVDRLCDMLQEMPPTDYALGPIGATVGKGQIVIQFPHNVFSDLIVGDLGGAKITAADIKQIKNLFE